MAEAKVSIAFRSNPARYSIAGNARLLNAYAEKQGDDAKTPMAVYACPGLVNCCTVTDTPGRGMIFCEDLNAIYSFHSSGAFKVTKTSDNPFTLTAVRVGTVPGVDQLQLSRNQAVPPQISVHSTSGEFYVQADIVKKVTDIDVTSLTVVSQDNVNGRTVYLDKTGKFFWSSINNCAVVDTLDFATAEQAADGGTCVRANGSDTFFFGVETIEPWRDVADVDLPFEPIGGATQNRGMISPLAVVSSDNTLMYPAEDNSLYRLVNYSSQKISQHYQDRLLEAEPDRPSIQGLSHSFQGHAFSYWTGTNFTTGYDSATQAPHDRQSYNLPNWRARNAVRAWGKTIVQDSQSGSLFYLDGDTFTEDGAPLIWGIDTPYLHNFPNGGIVDDLYIDVVTGVGTVLATDQGFAPKLMLSWTVDGGTTYKGFRELSLGVRGRTRTRIKTCDLGEFGEKGVSFRIRVSDPVIRGIMEMSANIRQMKK